MLHEMISLIFYMAFVIYIFMGIYCITLNAKEHLNRVFLAFCFCISIWAFAFTIFNSAGSYEEALLWRRISSLGWGTAYSVTVHFVLVLTGADSILKKKRTYAAIYLPAALIVFIFGIYTRTSSRQYNLVQTTAGWGNIYPNNFWDMVFNFYYISFSLIAAVLLIRWYKKIKDKIKKRDVLYLLLSFGISLLLGTLTDSRASLYLAFEVPSLAPVYILFPVLTINRIINKYGLMLPKMKKATPQEGIILTDDNRASLFRYISIIFYIGSVVNLLIYLVYSDALISGVVLSTILVLVGTIVFIIPSVTQSTRLQENIITVLISAAILAVIPPFYIVNISNIVWSIPLLALIVTIIFNNRKMFSVIAVISILSGIWSWIRVPELRVEVGTMDYVLRILIYGTGIILAGYIRNIYISRLKENEKQVKFQRMISAISADFVTVTSSNLDEKITGLLEKSGNYVQADHSYIGMLSEDLIMVHFTHEWLGDGIKSIMKNYKGLPAGLFTWAGSQLLDKKVVFIPNVDKLPPEAKEEKEIMTRENIKSTIFIPISNKDRVLGFLGFDQINEQKGWHIEDHDLLRVLANILADAISKVEVEKNINYLAYYDTLTGLPNRTLLGNRLEQAIHLARRTERMVGLMFIDLDGFKAVNDTLGHDWGDELLKQVAERLAQCIRKYDTAARFGGDEFLIMIPQIPRVKDVEEVAKKVMKIFEKPVTVNGQEFFVTASGGIAVFPVDGEEVNVLIKNADLAMYAAKNNGKGHYSFCSPGMKDDVLKKMMITNSLYRALERKELELYYQPQVNIQTGEITGMEALIRWNHPELGVVSPAVFIPIAEQTGLINSIGEWVLKTACRQNKEWQDMGLTPIKMAVNISVEQFRSGDLIHAVRSCIKETGLDPCCLELEITEGIAMKEANYVIKPLHELKDMEVSIAIDDFGTKYSSLSRLKDLPVDKLKIDMQFIHGISKNNKDESIISVMIHLAKSLGLKVVAEGVETDVQLDFLTREACDEVQGYYYYKPMSKEEIESSFLCF